MEETHSIGIPLVNPYHGNQQSYGESLPMSGALSPIRLCSKSATRFQVRQKYQKLRATFENMPETSTHGYNRLPWEIISHGKPFARGIPTLTHGRILFMGRSFPWGISASFAVGLGVP